MVVDRILKDSLEQERQLGRGTVGIFLGQLEHRVLDDVERRVVVANGELRVLERPPLDAGEEGRDFLRSRQRVVGSAMEARLAANYRQKPGTAMVRCIRT
jgi:hypothetical protein